MGLSREQALALLTEDANKPRRGGGGRTKADPTLVREAKVWFKLNHILREEGCDNPNCVDPRENDIGSNVVAEVKGKYICRFCFMDGYLVND